MRSAISRCSTAALSYPSAACSKERRAEPLSMGPALNMRPPEKICDLSPRLLAMGEEGGVSGARDQALSCPRKQSAMPSRQQRGPGCPADRTATGSDRQRRRFVRAGPSPAAESRPVSRAAGSAPGARRPPGAASRGSLVPHRRRAPAARGSGPGSRRDRPAARRGTWPESRVHRRRPVRGADEAGRSRHQDQRCDSLRCAQRRLQRDQTAQGPAEPDRTLRGRVEAGVRPGRAAVVKQLERALAVAGQLQAPDAPVAVSAAGSPSQTAAFMPQPWSSTSPVPRPGSPRTGSCAWPLEPRLLARQTAKGLQQPVHILLLVRGGKGDPQPRGALRAPLAGGWR